MQPTEPIDEPRRHDPASTPYSRTDARGVILAGNADLAELTAYPPEAIQGAPHRLLRHPDMPRQAFLRLWSRLQAGLIAPAYLKNLAADGRHCWVLSIILPDGDGYLSVQRPARTMHLDTAQKLLRAERMAEAAGAPPPEVLAASQAVLAEQGFADHDSFMIEAVIAEFAQQPGLADLPQRLTTLLTMRQDLQALQSEQAALLNTFRTLYLIPTNMRILASRLEPSGGPVSAISDSYKRTATELITRLNGTGTRGQGTAVTVERLNGVILRQAAATLLDHAARDFDAVAPFGSTPQAERSRIAEACAKAGAASLTDLDEIRRAVRQARRDAESLQRLMAGLEQVRILGEVESGRLRSRDGGLAAIMQQLEEFHARIRDRLTALINLTTRMNLSDEDGMAPLA